MIDSPVSRPGKLSPGGERDAAVSATALAGCGRGRDGRECGKRARRPMESHGPSPIHARSVRTTRQPDVDGPKTSLYQRFSARQPGGAHGRVTNVANPWTSLKPPHVTGVSWRSKPARAAQRRP